MPVQTRSTWSSRSAAALGGAAVVLAMLAGCGTPDPLQTVAEATSSPRKAPIGGAETSASADPSGSSTGSGASDSGAEDGGGGTDPVETNEVRLTWVETGGASRASLVLGEDTPYQAIFEIATASAAGVPVDSVELGPGGDGSYSIASDGCTGLTVTNGSPCIVTVDFDPPAAGSYATTLVVTYAGGGRAELLVPIDVTDDSGSTDGGGTGGGTGSGDGGETLPPTESSATD